MRYKKHIINLSSKLNEDTEHDEYILMALMGKLNINPQDEQSYSFLYKRLCEEIDMLIDDLNPNQKYFNNTDSEFIKSTEVVLNRIEVISMPDEEPIESFPMRF
jgi:hypothetical protein